MADVRYLLGGSDFNFDRVLVGFVLLIDLRSSDSVKGVASPKQRVAKGKVSSVERHKALVEEFATVEEGGASQVWGESLSARMKNLQAGVSDRTGQGYNYWWNRFVLFCGEAGCEPMPFTAVMVSAFLSNLAEKSSGLGGVDGARAALGFYWKMKFPDVTSPTEEAEVSAVLHGIKRRFQLPVTKKEALSVEDFGKVLRHVTEGGELEKIAMCKLRLAAQVSVMFCCFARFEEVQALKVQQVKVGEVDIEVDFLKGKTYQYGECRLGMMPAQPHLALDPVEVVKAYLARLRKLGVKETSWLFPSFSSVKGVDRVLVRAASYDCVRKQFKAACAAAQVSGKPADYGLHSMRRGAATGAVNNGSSDHEVMKQMRVSSQETVRRYATLDRKKLSTAVNLLFSQS